MQTRVSTKTVVLALPIMMVWINEYVDARPMHAGIIPEYLQYLKEKEKVADELENWLKVYGPDGTKMGFMPVTESRSGDQKEDLQQRLYMTKNQIKDAQKANPQAVLGTQGPFTLMTMEEFHDFLSNGHVTGDNKTETSRVVVPKALSNDSIGTSSTNTSKNGYSEKNHNKDGDNDGTTSTRRVPATKAPTVIAATRRLRNAEKSQSAFDGEDNSADEEMGFESIADSDTPHQSQTYQHNTATVEGAANRKWNFDDVSTGDMLAPPASAPVPVVDSSMTARDLDSDSVDWSTSVCVSDPELQGQCSSDWAFATVAALEAVQCIYNGNKKAPTYSKQQLVSCDKKNFGCNGGAPVYAMEYVRDNGICLESSYGYTSEEGGQAAACLKSCTPTESGITDIGVIETGDESALLSVVKQQPVIASVISSNPAWKQYISGVITACPTAEVDHAVLVVGYDVNTIKIKNSWGTDWGENGYVRISRSSQNMGTCAVLTDMSYPTL